MFRGVQPQRFFLDTRGGYLRIGLPQTSRMCVRFRSSSILLLACTVAMNTFDSTHVFAQRLIRMTTRQFCSRRSGFTIFSVHSNRRWSLAITEKTAGSSREGTFVVVLYATSNHSCRKQNQSVSFAFSDSKLRAFNEKAKQSHYLKMKRASSAPHLHPFNACTHTSTARTHRTRIFFAR